MAERQCGKAIVSGRSLTEKLSKCCIFSNLCKFHGLIKRTEMVKEKLNSVRTYDSDGFRRRAACVCVHDDIERDVLLVSGSKCPEKWVVPGGGIEPTEDAGEAALREVKEEAGVIGSLGRCLGVFENKDRKTRTSVYVLVVTEFLDEWEDSKSIGRRRSWFPLVEALAQLALHKPVQKGYLELLNSAQSPS